MQWCFNNRCDNWYWSVFFAAEVLTRVCSFLSIFRRRNFSKKNNQYGKFFPFLEISQGISIAFFRISLNRHGRVQYEFYVYTLSPGIISKQSGFFVKWFVLSSQRSPLKRVFSFESFKSNFSSLSFCRSRKYFNLYTSKTKCNEKFIRRFVPIVVSSFFVIRTLQDQKTRSLIWRLFSPSSVVLLSSEQDNRNYFFSIFSQFSPSVPIGTYPQRFQLHLCTSSESGKQKVTDCPSGLEC